MTREELIEAFSFDGINHSNAVVNFTEQDPFDPKAVWLNAEYIRALPLEDLARQLLPFAPGPDARKMQQVAPLIQERIKLLGDVRTVADFFFADQLAPYDLDELIPQKGDRALALKVLQQARETLATTAFTHDALDAALRADAAEITNQAGPDVPAHPGGGMRPEDRAAVVRNTGSDGAAGHARSNRPSHRGAGRARRL